MHTPSNFESVPCWVRCFPCIAGAVALTAVAVAAAFGVAVPTNVSVLVGTYNLVAVPLAFNKLPASADVIKALGRRL